MKKVLIGVGALLVVLVVAAVGILATVDLDGFINDNRTKLTEAASEQLGRRLTLGNVETSLFPRLSARLEAAALAGPSGSETSQAEVGGVEVTIDVWRALFSFGKELRVDEVVIRGLVLRVKRDADGVWDFSDITDRLKAGSADASTKKSDDPADLSFLEGAHLRRAALEEARLEIDDASLGRPLVIDKINLELTDVELGAPVSVTLGLVLVDGDSKTPLNVEATLSELRRDLSFDPVPDTTIDAKMGRLDLTAWGTLLPRGTIAPSAGELEMDLATTLRRNLQHVEAKGFVELHDVVLTQGGVSGLPLGMKLTVDADADLDQGPRVAVRSASLNGTGVDVAATADLTALSAAGLKKADVKLTVADLRRLLAVVPSSAPLLPAELTLEGPIEAHIVGNPKTLDVGLDLDRAHVAWADSFDKKKGRPLHLTMKGNNSGTAFTIPAFSLTVDAVNLKGSLGLPLQQGAPFTADISSGTTTFASLREILPPIAKALDGGNKVDGNFTLVAKAKAVGERQDAEVQLRLSDLDVNLASLTAKGSGAIDASAHPQGDVITALVTTDLNGLVLKSVDDKGATVLNKPKGMPLALDTKVVQTPSKITIDHADLTFGKTVVHAAGSVTAPGTPDALLDLDLGRLDIAFDDVRRTVPGAAALPAGGYLKGAVKVGGNPERMGTLSVNAKALDLGFGSTRVRGDVDVKNLEAPELKVALSELKLVFNDLRPLDESLQAALPSGGQLVASKVAVSGNTAQMATVKASANVDKLVYSTAEVSGSLSFENPERPQFAFDLQSPYLNLDELLGTEDDKKKQPKKKKVEDESERTNPHGLEPDLRAQLAKISGTGKLRVNKAIFSGLEMRDFVGDLVMERGRITFNALDFTLYQGRISAAGTTLGLASQYTAYDLKLQATRLNLGQAINDNTDYRGVVDGFVSKSLQLSGRGLAKQDLVRTLTGSVSLNTDDLGLTKLDVLAPINSQVQSALSAAGAGGRFKGLAAGRAGTRLKNVKAALSFDKGDYRLTKPLDTKTAFGDLSLRGGGKLDGTLDLQAVAKLDPSTINGAMGRQVVTRPVDVPLQIGGTWDKPRVTGVDVGALVRSVAGGAAAEAAEALKKKAEEETARLQAEARAQAEAARREAEAQAARARDEAKRRADEARAEAKRQTDAAKAEADRRRREAEEEARRRADAAKREAEERARKAREKAEREAKKRADAEKKKAKDEANKLKDKAKDMLGF